MFFVSDVTNANQELLNYSNFKAWWDVLQDYLVGFSGVSLFLIFTRIISFDTGLLICTHPESGKAYGYAEARYINSRCCRESNAWVFIFYPHIMMTTWMLMTIFHLSWLKVPSVSSKMASFSHILQIIFSTSPIQYRNPNTPFQVAPNFVYDDKNSKQIENVLNRLLYLLTERPFLRRTYIVKHILMVLMSSVSVGVSLFITIRWTQFNFNFFCNLELNPPFKRSYPYQISNNTPTPCHLNSGFFILFSMQLDLLFRVLLMALSIRAIHWILLGSNNYWNDNFYSKSKNNDKDSRNKQPFDEVAMELQNNNVSNSNFNNNRLSKNENEHYIVDYNAFFDREMMRMNKVLGEADEYLSGMPGFEDLVFWVELLKRNAHDGQLMYNSIKSAIQSFVKRFKLMRNDRIEPNVQSSDKKKDSTQNELESTFGLLTENNKNSAANEEEYVKKKKKSQYGHQRRKTEHFENGENEENEEVYERVKLDVSTMLNNSICLTSWLCNQLGFVLKPNNLKPNNLFKALQEIGDSVGFVALDCSKTFREKIADEIQSKPATYKTYVDSNILYPDFETYCTALRDGNTYGAEYVLLAAATMFRVRIVLIAVQTISVSKKTRAIPEVYSPVAPKVIIAQEKKQMDEVPELSAEKALLPTKYLTFIEPYYFFLNEDSSDETSLLVTKKRLKYANDKEYRNQLKIEAYRRISAYTSIRRFFAEVHNMPHVPKNLF